MKKFSTHHIHRVHNIVAFAIVGVLFVSAYFTNFTAFKASEVRADASSNVSGWAYSMGNGVALNDDKPGIGWISFNSSDCDTDGNGFTDSGACGGNNSTTVARDYGVNIDTGTGNFSGKAWSENIGWISFDSTDLANCPSGACNAQVDLTTGKVTGWARALAGCQESAGVPATSCSSGAAGAAAGAATAAATGKKDIVHSAGTEAVFILREPVQVTIKEGPFTKE